MSRQPAFASLRRTAAELVRHPEPRPPLGEYLWKPTREVRFRSPVRAVSGRLLSRGVFHQRNGKVFCRPYVIPADPKTVRQLHQRERMSVIQRHWKNLSSAERAGWSHYAAQALFPERRDEQPGGLGLNAYLKAQSMRLAWGGELGSTPPVAPPPAAPLGLAEAAAHSAGQLAFRVEHGLEDVAGYRLVVDMTPATPNGRKPRPGDLRRAAEMTAESFFPLGKSGAVYLLERPRYAVAAGERFALRVRLITPDGIPGVEILADLHKGAMLPEDDGAEVPVSSEQVSAPAEPRLLSSAGLTEGNAADRNAVGTELFPGHKIPDPGKASRIRELLTFTRPAG